MQRTASYLHKSHRYSFISTFPFTGASTIDLSATARTDMSHGTEKTYVDSDIRKQLLPKGQVTALKAVTTHKEDHLLSGGTGARQKLTRKETDISSTKQSGSKHSNIDNGHHTAKEVICVLLCICIYTVYHIMITFAGKKYRYETIRHITGEESASQVV